MPDQSNGDALSEPDYAKYGFVAMRTVDVLLAALRDIQQNNATDNDGNRGYELWADALVLKKYEAQEKRDKGITGHQRRDKSDRSTAKRRI